MNQEGLFLFKENLIFQYTVPRIANSVGIVTLKFHKVNTQELCDKKVFICKDIKINDLFVLIKDKERAEDDKFVQHKDIYYIDVATTLDVPIKVERIHFPIFKGTVHTFVLTSDDDQKDMETKNEVYSKLLKIYPSDTWINQTTNQEDETKP